MKESNYNRFADEKTGISQANLSNQRFSRQNVRTSYGRRKNPLNSTAEILAGQMKVLDNAKQKTI